MTVKRYIFYLFLHLLPLVSLDKTRHLGLTHWVGSRTSRMLPGMQGTLNKFSWDKMNDYIPIKSCSSFLRLQKVNDLWDFQSRWRSYNQLYYDHFTNTSKRSASDRGRVLRGPGFWRTSAPQPEKHFFQGLFTTESGSQRQSATHQTVFLAKTAIWSPSPSQTKTMLFKKNF